MYTYQHQTTLNGKPTYQNDGFRDLMGFFPRPTVGSQYLVDQGHFDENSVFWNDLSNILTPDSHIAMERGLLPDLFLLSHQLNNAIVPGFQNSALQFERVLRELAQFSADDVKKFLSYHETNQVLIHNENLKVVLIAWEPGKISTIHGHPSGGCLFKVLHGKIKERRFSNDDNQHMLSANTYYKGGMGYIDDEIALHQVSNPFREPAISIHAYTPGK